MGLIEAYQTVLERGRALSIDSDVNDQGANAALLNVTSRIAQLYMLLANDAYIDALDPIVGFDDSTLGIRASAVYAFANQFRPDQFGPIDEELALLRGRDETLGGVAAGPTYNRLTWNFTNGEGEVAYVMNYNIDGHQPRRLHRRGGRCDHVPAGPRRRVRPAADRADACTINCCKHPNYTWIPRAEPVSVAGAPVVVDYYDERRFAAAAAARARMGAEVVNLTYRKNYSEPEVQPYQDSYVDNSDTCNPTERARRAATSGRGAWRTGPAGRPKARTSTGWSPTRLSRRKTIAMRTCARSTGPRSRTLPRSQDQMDAIQVQLDRADTGANPLGLVGGAVLFDLDPALTKTTPGGGEGSDALRAGVRQDPRRDGELAEDVRVRNQAKDAQRVKQDEQHDFAADICRRRPGNDQRADRNLRLSVRRGHRRERHLSRGLRRAGHLQLRPDRAHRPDRRREALRRPGSTTARPKPRRLLVEYPRMPCLGHLRRCADRRRHNSRRIHLRARGLGSDPLNAEGRVQGRRRAGRRPRPLPARRLGSGARRKAWGEIQQKMWSVV